MNRFSPIFSLFALAALIALTLANCRMDRSTFMTAEQQERLETTYDSLQSSFNALVESNKDTLSDDLRSLYSRMQEMHRMMDASHRRMLSMNMGHHEEMMGRGMGMGMHRQGMMTGEWYQQMMAMHEQMASIHQKSGEQGMARMNRRLADGFGRMMRMLPGDGEPGEEDAGEPREDPSTLDGAALYSSNCASCHGTDGEGIAGAFPPLVDSRWVTGEKSVPIRILLNGLSGEIEVQGRTYQGVMPSFKARLSAGEMAAILNYLRSQSEEDLQEISREEVVRTREAYGSRPVPWSAGELTAE